MEMAIVKESKSTENIQPDFLDFDKTREIARTAKTKKEHVEEILTPDEIESIPEYMSDMTKYIKSYAKQGKFNFKYDCANLTKICFVELAKQFKQKNPRFFVVTDFGTQILIVDWSGKNEV